jgi:pimeloyl-ACP methyl ester carboxylesterase
MAFEDLPLQQLPRGFHSAYTDCGEVRLHFVHNAARVRDDGTLDDPRTPIVMLHGFPEYWAGWKPVFAGLQDRYLIIAPDQRGYNLSDAPLRTESYASKKLVSDLLALTSNLLGNRKFVLAGHDWGAAVAYSAAISVPERLTALVIVNGVHPIPFQKALIADEGQARASQYFHFLRAPDAAEKMSEDGFRRAFAMLEKFSAAPWLDDAEREAYRRAWSQPGRMNAMLNWYRSSPIVVPVPGEPVPAAPLADADPRKFMVSAPHLLIWGSRDPALLPASRAGLDRFAPLLQVVEIPDGDHWVIHTHGDRIAREMDAFVSALAPR